MRPFSSTNGLATFANIEPEIERSKKKLQPYYEYYIKNISRADMAASLELSAFIFSICKINQYKKVLDMGSGLSSFVLRLYAKETPDVKVFSVDDDAAWLEKTKDFLCHYQVNADNVLMLDQFLKNEESGFDCVLHDLNFTELRINYAEKLMALVKQDGLVIFDDVHKPDYLFALLMKMKNFKCKIYNLKPVTCDRYGRFSLVVVKK